MPVHACKHDEMTAQRSTTSACKHGQGRTTPHLRKAVTVRCAISSGLALPLGHAAPGMTIWGFRMVPSRYTFCQGEGG